MKLKIYTDLDLLKIDSPVQLLIPFVGTKNGEDHPGRMMSSRFDEFKEKGKDIIELTSLEDADVCLLPIYYRLHGDVAGFEKSIESFVKKVEASNKKTIVFAGHDFDKPVINIQNSIVFNSAVIKSKKYPNSYSWPHFFEDFIKVYQNGDLNIREKQEIPTVGFRGFVPPFKVKDKRAKIIGTIKLLANYLGIIQNYPGYASHSYRARAILGLKYSKKVKTNFNLKENFAFGGPVGMLNQGDTNESDEMFRRNFIANIIESDYTLCVRGIGNNSVRFFETICCGRIPVFVNTDAELPFDFHVNWKDMCVWVEEKDIDRIDEIVLKFHQSISPEEFKERQKKMRALWEEYCSPVGFFKHLNLFLDLPDARTGSTSMMERSIKD